MPYRANASLWFNLPGVVAVYQPVAAPGPLLARYNQAHGGDNRYRAVPTTATEPEHRPAAGWILDGTNAFGAEIGGSASNWSVLVSFDAWSSAPGNTTCLSGALASNDSTSILRIVPRDDATRISFYHYGIAYSYQVVTSGVLGLAGETGFYNGQAVATVSQSGALSVSKLGIGCAWTHNYGYGWTATCHLRALIYFSRTLSAAEMWQASRQMAYCHVNPDWSAWGRRRRYYYAPPEIVAPPVTADDLKAAAAVGGAFGPVLGRAARMGHQQAAGLPAAARAGHRSRLNG